MITTALWAALVLVMVGVVVGQFWRPRHNPPELPTYYNVGAFSLVDENGKPFTEQDLRGRPYVADIIFTTCAGTCPIMSSKLAEVQKLTPAGVQLVSFTVNPEFDTPAVLKEYAHRYHADESRWHFLTGSPQQMQDAAKKTLKLPASPPEAQNPIGHSDRLLLIDGAGNVRGIYDGRDDETVKRLAADASSLARRGNGA